MNTNDGSIALIFGPMFSGKSSELQRRLRRFAVAKKRTLLIKYCGDTRYDETAGVTHDNIQVGPPPPSFPLAARSLRCRPQSSTR